MGLNTLTFRQCIPGSIGEAWDFFSAPSNLARITPPEMMFRIVNGAAGQPIYEGMLITYTLYPFMMLPVQWETEITKVERPFFSRTGRNRVRTRAGTITICSVKFREVSR